MWDETVTKRGSQEIASCIYKYLKDLEPGSNEIIFYRDCCPGLNTKYFCQFNVSDRGKTNYIYKVGQH